MENENWSMSDHLFNTTAEAVEDPEREIREDLVVEARQMDSDDLPGWVREKIDQGKVDADSLGSVIRCIETDEAFNAMEKLRFTIADLEALPSILKRTGKKILPMEKLKELAAELTEYVNDVLEDFDRYYRDILSFESTKRKAFDSPEEMRAEHFATDRNRRIAHNGVVRALADLYRFCYGPYPNGKTSLFELGIDLGLRESFFPQKVIDGAWAEVRDSGAVRENCHLIGDWIRTAVPGNNLLILKNTLQKHFSAK
jgi:hypothetical protein